MNGGDVVPGLGVPTWIINLDRSTERRREMVRHLSGLGIEHEIVRAVDGRALGEKEFAAYSRRDAIKHSGRELKTGEIACALSHYSLWERMLREKVNEVLILEDDAVLGRNFPHVVARRASFPEGWELINFHSDAPRRAFGRPIYDIHRVCTFTWDVNGAVAYLLRASGAEKLMRAAYPIRLPLDGVLGNRAVAGLRIYGVHPEVVTISGVVSDINEAGAKAPAVRLTYRLQQAWRRLVRFARTT